MVHCSASRKLNHAPHFWLKVAVELERDFLEYIETSSLGLPDIGMIFFRYLCRRDHLHITRYRDSCTTLLHHLFFSEAALQFADSSLHGLTSILDSLLVNSPLRAY